MMGRRRIELRRAALRLALGALVCLPPGGSVHAETLRVFAASSLTDAFTEIGGIFEAAHPGVKLEFNFSNSQVLQTQIEQGARADVFASADRAQATALEREGLLIAPRVFAHNALVVVTSEESPRIRALSDLARPGVKIVVASRSAPIGRYTDDALGKMAASDSFGVEYRTRVEANIVSRETNVRVVLAKVALGEADAGFVYRTDAELGKGRVNILAIPESLNVIAEYPVGLLANAPSAGMGGAFIELVLGHRGQEVLGRHGFVP